MCVSLNPADKVFSNWFRLSQTNYSLFAAESPELGQTGFFKGCLTPGYRLSLRHRHLQLWRWNVLLRQGWNVPVLRWALVEQPLKPLAINPSLGFRRFGVITMCFGDY